MHYVRKLRTTQEFRCMTAGFAFSALQAASTYILHER